MPERVSRTPDIKRAYDDRAEDIAQAFHETYEQLAPRFGYRTREASAKPWEEVPEDNRRLMVATVRALMHGRVIR